MTDVIPVTGPNLRSSVSIMCGSWFIEEANIFLGGNFVYDTQYACIIYFTKHISYYYRREVAMNKALIGLLASIFILSACGGGSGVDAPSTTQPTDIPKSGHNYYGRVIPEEPSNTAPSLAGVDSNNNNVRDDVERALASIFKSDSDFRISMKGASELQKLLVGSDLDYQKIEKNFTCSTTSLGDANQALIRNLVFNTIERLAVVKATSGTQPTSVEILIDDAGNAVNPCRN